MAFDFKKTQKKLREHLAKAFLFVIRDENTFEEIATYRLTFLNVYILLSTVFCIAGLLTFLLITLTPLRNLVPGYGDIRFSGEYQQLTSRLQKIEQEVAARDVYIESLIRLLSGKPETVKDITKDVHFKLESPDPVQKIREDSLLREAFESSKKQNARAPDRPKTQADKGTAPVLRRQLEDIDFTCPLRGPIGAAFKPDKDHYGIDIIGPEHSPIKAVLPGSVIQSDWSMENGHTIAIQHADNLVSVYKHNSALLRKLGAQVKAGEAIAIIGNTGTLTQGPHLHFELWYQGRCINPQEYIRFN